MKQLATWAALCVAGMAWAEKMQVFSPARTVEEKIALADRTLEYVRRSVSSEKLDKLAAELAVDKAWWAKAKSEGEKYACERAIMSVRRRILFQHPDLQFRDLLAVQRGFPFAEEPGMTDQYMGRWSRPGPGLVAIRDWKNAPRKKVLLEGKLPKGCTLNPCLHWDAEKVIFSFNDHERPAPADPRKVHVPPLMNRNADGSLRQPMPDEIRESDPDNPNLNPAPGRDEFSCVHHRYFIYEAAVDGSWVKQLTGTPADPMTTPDGLATSLIEDVDPCYLPGGGFVFCSTRAQNYGRCHWGRYVASFLLYRADDDGGNISQFSFAEANEWRPEMLSDGRLVYTRWDYVDRYAAKFAGLWVTRPDGTAVDIVYGNYSDTMRSCAAAHPVPGTRQIVAVAGAHHMFTTGTLVIVDPLAGEDGEEPLTRLTPDTGILESEGWYQKGAYTDPMPVNDTLFFASYSPDSFGYPQGHPHDSVPNIRAHWQNPRSYGVWLVDRLGGRELIYQDPEWSTFNPTPIVRRAKPPALASSLPPAAEAPDTGLFYLRNVYDCRQPIPPGSVKAIRVNRLHNMHPCRRGGAFRQGANYAYHKEPLGIVPVAPDGSAYFRLPAEVPIQLQAVDTNGMAVMTMRSAIYTRKGEIQGCAGCHERKSNAAPVDGRLKGREPDVPRPEVDLGYQGPFSFVKSVQPVLDRHCIRCHGLDGGKAMSLVGTNGLMNLVYEDWDIARERFNFRQGARRLVSMAISYQETNESKPYDYFAAASPLTWKIRGGHGGAKLTPDEMQTLVLWMDLNVTPFSFGGGYSWNRAELNGIDAEGEKTLRAAVLARWGMRRANEPIEALVNRADPAKSRVLLAALPEAAGGWGQWEKPFTGRDDPEFARFAKLAEGAVKRSPWKDVRGTCGRDDKCACNSCWIRLGGYNDPKALAALAPRDCRLPANAVVVQDAPGYNSWPMIQAAGDRLVCTYSRDNARPADGHTIHPGSRDSYAKTSLDGGRTWSEETTIAADPTIGEVNEGIGLDSTGAVLAWVRCWGGKDRRRHELYRSTDGRAFEKICSLTPEPFPMQVMDPVSVPGLGLVSPWFAGNYRQGGKNSWGLLVSADDGRSWRQQTIEDGLSVKEWVTEPSLVALDEKRLLIIGRCEQNLGPQFQVTSTDGGRTWRKRRTNIADVCESTPSIIYDPKTGLVANYYYHRGARRLKRRVAPADFIFDHPDQWPEPEVLAEGFEPRAFDAGNVKATRFKGEVDCCAWYTGTSSNAAVVVTHVKVP